MKNKFILTSLFLLFITAIVAGQVTEAEKKMSRDSEECHFYIQNRPLFELCRYIKVPFDTNDDGTLAEGEAVGSKIQFKEILGVGFSYKF